jgi:tRNA (guanine-N7-)-methyltransferase
MRTPIEIELELGVPIPGPILPPEKWARTALKQLPPPGPLNWEALFGRRAPRVLDLGCGNGRFLVGSAWMRPHMDHIGTDILPVVIRYATKRANQRGLANARFAVIGGSEFLERYVAPGTIDEIHVYHPQPYGDPGKLEHRLITPSFLARVHAALVPGGLFVIQTDNPAYWSYIARHCPRFFDFRVQREPWLDAPRGRTRREIMALQKGLPIFRATGTPRPELTAERLSALVAELPPPTFDADIRKRLGRYGRGKRR